MHWESLIACASFSRQLEEQDREPWDEERSGRLLLKSRILTCRHHFVTLWDSSTTGWKQKKGIALKKEAPA